eukprot:TRINITY_DN68150_c1_g1_i1.p2 TRINITY_DN68150_c1_g1~~TRINITY_DN68150_c1_g1_i1.p2  ORF type:complete len:155 (-),score=24.42 TRINITY_DN68150_c1_g1_i1:733-1197(-)
MALEKVYRTTEPKFQNLLQHFRDDQVGPDDTNLLEERIVQPEQIPLTKDTRVVVRSNELRDELNWEFVVMWARKHKQRMVVVLAEDSLRPFDAAKLWRARLSEDLLLQQYREEQRTFATAQAWTQLFGCEWNCMAPTKPLPQKQWCVMYLQLPG